MVVQGRVQGVGFRYWTQREAEQLGLRGWVRNCDDGSVQAVFEGESSVLKQMVDLIKSGPSLARVDSCVTEYSAYADEFSDFCIRRS